MMLVTVFLSLVAIHGSVSASRPFPRHHAESTNTLYAGNDPVAQLHATNFTELLSGGSTAWAVEFYASWCGHCQRFAPTWLSLAKNVKGWTSVIRVAAVACSHPDNVDLCRKYEVQSYPAIKFFLPNAGNDPVGQRYGGAESYSEIRMAMVDFVESVEDPPSSWPQLQPLHNLLSSIEAERGGHTALVIFEDVDDAVGEDRYLAREVILDLSAYSDLHIGRMLKMDGSNHGVTVFPSLYRVKADGSLDMLADSLDRREFGDVIHQSVLQDYSTTTLGATLSWPSTTVIPVVPDGVHIQDLESSVFYSLWQEVARHDVIAGPSMVALQNHIAVMAKYYPGKQHTVLFLKKLDRWIRDVDSLTGEQWLHHLNTMQTPQAYVPRRVIWTGCHGSQPQYRGYPCSVWTTYHTLTVQAYLAEEEQAPKDVLMVMRDFVEHFLSCRECADNFAKMAAEIDSDVTDRKSGVLWLWQAHNRANLRLHDDTTEDAHHPKAQFPVYSACVECHVARPVSNYVATEWNEDAVLAYLVRFYSEKLVDDTLDYTFVPMEEEEEEEEEEDGLNNRLTSGATSNRVWPL